MRAIRGATTVDENSAIEIDRATRELLEVLAARNALEPDDVVCIFFTLTPDLDAAFPARSARELGWDVPMLDMQEVNVPDALVRCLRLLILTRTDRTVRHAYLRGAHALRPDLEPS